MNKRLFQQWSIRRPSRGAAGLATAVTLALILGVRAAIATVAPTSDSAEPTHGEVAAAVSPEATTESSPAQTAADATSDTFNLSGGGARQIVNVKNSTDDRYVSRGKAQLNQIAAPRVGPVNIAIARSIGCADCETLAVALQISVYHRGAPLVAPQNAAVAANGGCLRCFTMAVAIQYLIPVDETTTIPSDVRRLARDLNAELQEVTHEDGTSVRGRLTKLFGIIDRFREFAAYVDVRLHQATEPDATVGDPIATPLPAPTDDPAATFPPDATPTEAPTAEPQTPVPTPEPTPTESAETSPEPTAEPSPVASEPPSPGP